MKNFLFLWALLLPVFGRAQQPITWRFDSLTSVGGHAPAVVGSPRIVNTEIGKAMHFTGIADAAGVATTGDALFVDTLPLAGAQNYTLELIFRPSSSGAKEQRIFHLQEAGSESRRMFEIRIVDHRWCLDTVAFNYPPGQKARSGVMLNCDAQHVFPLDHWYAVAAVYDGKVLRAYVDGVLQGEIAVDLLPLAPGGTSIGTRYTRRDFFTGDMYEARFTAAALAPAQFLKVP